jgi:metallo-beta-lactamase family protein
VIIGFQAEHTLGRRLVERQPKLRIHDHFFPLNASVEILNGLSGHADAVDFKWWYEHLSKTGGVGLCFLVHGEPVSARALARLVHDYCDEDPVIPKLYESFDV